MLCDTPLLGLQRPISTKNDPININSGQIQVILAENKVEHSGRAHLAPNIYAWAYFRPHIFEIVQLNARNVPAQSIY